MLLVRWSILSHFYGTTCRWEPACHNEEKWQKWGVTVRASSNFVRLFKTFIREIDIFIRSVEIYIRRVHKYIRHLPTDCNFCPPKHNKYAPYYNLVAEKYFPQPSTRVYKFHIPRVYRELRTLQVADILLFYISRYQYTTIVVATLASTSSVWLYS